MMWRKLILNSLYFSGAQGVLKPKLGGIGSIFMLHRVQNVSLKPFAPNYHLSASPDFLDRVILHLKTQGYEFISMDEVARRLKSPEKYEGKKPFLAITLDDGYRDNLINAVPVFRRHEVPYMIYVAPGLTDAKAPLWWENVEHIIARQKKIHVELEHGAREFDVSTVDKKMETYKFLIEYMLLETDQRAQRETVAKLCKAYGFDCTAHVTRELMGWSELKSLQKDPLCSLGAHTVNHFALARLDADDAESEMEESRDILKSRLGIEARHLAYPYGYHQVAGEREFDIASRLGFETATTTRHGVLYAEHKEHMTALPRVSLNGHHQSMRYVNTLLSGIPTRFKNRGRKLDIA